MPRTRRSSPDQPGWTRRRAGKGFVYLDEHGERLCDEDCQRVKDLVIPPAWQDVWICRWPNGHLQAVGTDDAGRRQYLYHPDWRAKRDSEKFTRVLEFGRALSKARERVLTDLGTEGMTLVRASATAVRLLDLGYFRIGNDVYADENGSFGLTTLERRHVRRSGDRLVFEFTGKSGVEHEITIDDPPTVEALESMRRRRGGGDRLLAYKDGRRWAPLDSARVNDYVREATGLEATAKDFRTWHATVLAAAALARDRRARHQQGFAQAGRGGGDEGGLRLPREHPRAGEVVVRRPAGRRGLRGGRHDRRGDPAQLCEGRRASGRLRAGRAPPAEEDVTMRITVVEGDITRQDVDAVVNAANSRMRGGGGVDGAIHAAGGPAILADCVAALPARARAPGTPAGRPAGDLPARWVIHVVGPNRNAGQTDRSLLTSCYSRALQVADELGARSVAFPLVSAGVYGWPREDAIAAAIETLDSTPTLVEEARLVAFGRPTYDAIVAALES